MRAPGRRSAFGLELCVRGREVGRLLQCLFTEHKGLMCPCTQVRRGGAKGSAQQSLRVREQRWGAQDQMPIWRPRGSSGGCPS